MAGPVPWYRDLWNPGGGGGVGRLMVRRRGDPPEDLGRLETERFGGRVVRRGG